MSLAFDLSGRTALITGGAAGIGRAICDMLANSGASIVVLDYNKVAVDKTVSELRQRGHHSIAAHVDLADSQDITKMLNDLSQQGVDVDILVLCASAELREPWHSVTGPAMETQWATNLSASVQLVRDLVPSMQARGFGRVIAVGSVQEIRPRDDCLIYAATKAAQTHMMLNWARHAVQPGITFNVLRPGAIATDRNRAVLADPAYRQAVIDKIPLERIGQPTDCAGVVALLCSEHASYINGAVIDVDGGMRL